MDDDISDPSDWTVTQLPSLSTLDASLRCRICKDFFTSPVMTECSHTFCSLCIRKCVAATPTSETPCCPICRASVLEVRLKRNQVVEDLAEWFGQSRKSIMQVAVAKVDGEASSLNESKKRKRDGESQDSELVRTRRSSRTAAKVSYKEKLETDLETEDGTETERSPSSDGRAHSSYVNLDSAEDDNDGLVLCPVCQKRMTETQVIGHIDNCLAKHSEQPIKTTDSPRKAYSGPLTTLKNSHSLKQAKKIPLQRLPKLQYGLLTDSKLRSRMTELGISSHGTRAQLQARHSEFVSLWNANTDSANPKSKTQLIRELTAWESNMARYSKEKVDSIDDMDQWKQKHSTDFDSLIQKARKGVTKKPDASAEKIERDDASTIDEPVNPNEPDLQRDTNLELTVQTAEMPISH
ncbi:hypothetical protein V1512DRAFT_258090 [Lipomyces arxii]|uniref:uncharacterized protein n=1 Tax=Lipomyces arxii TaxID=56418 RepID=UPI0034CF7340